MDRANDGWLHHVSACAPLSLLVNFARVARDVHPCTDVATSYFIHPEINVASASESAEARACARALAARCATSFMRADDEMVPVLHAGTPHRVSLRGFERSHPQLVCVLIREMGSEARGCARLRPSIIDHRQ